MCSSVKRHVVYQCWPSGLIEQRHESLSSAAAAMGVACNAIRYAIENRTRCGGWHWRDRLGDGWKPARVRRGDPASVWVNGNRVTFANRAAAADVLGMSRTSVDRRRKWPGGHAA